MEPTIKPKKIKKPEYNNSPEYNKAYYEKNKAKICEALKKKCVCELCGRTTSYQRLKKHQTTSLCIGNRNNDKYEELKEQVEHLKKLLINI
jgi:hypothetical protein